MATRAECTCHIYTFATFPSLASQQTNILATLVSLASQQTNVLVTFVSLASQRTNVLATFACLANVVSTYLPKYTQASMIRYVVLCTKTYFICIEWSSLNLLNLPNSHKMLQTRLYANTCFCHTHQTWLAQVPIFDILPNLTCRSHNLNTRRAADASASSHSLILSPTTCTTSFLNLIPKHLHYFFPLE